MTDAATPEDVIHLHRARTERFGPAPGQAFQHLRLLLPADCAASPPRAYVVKELIGRHDLGLIIGQPGAGKSIVAPHIGYAVAQGRTVFGRRTRQGRVLYVPCEDPHGMRQRVHALKLEHGDATDFHLVEGVSDLFAKDGRDGDALAALVEKTRPLLVIVDTLAAAFPGLRENESEDMGRVLAVAKRLRDLGAAVLLIHHAPKADDASPRGHGSLNGTADVVLRLAIDTDTGAVAGRLGKNRNGPCVATLGFSIKSVAIGVDEDGDRITAPIADELDEADRRASAGPRLTKAEATARRFLADLICERGQLLPTGPNFPSGLHGVSETDWRASCEDRRLSTAETPKDRARVFRRAYQDLLTKGIVAVRDGLVWLTRPEERP